MPAQPLDAEKQQNEALDTVPKKLPRGVVLGPDGKPCRSCTSFASWAAMTKRQPSNISSTTPPASAAASLSPPPNCPPDVDELGRSSWNLLHTITANYPVSPSPQQQHDARSFISSFSRLYPCWVCAEDFQQWMKDERNAPRVSSRQEFGRWMCEAHNEVNVKLGKESFNCDRWEERWRTGWKDGSCD
ncbi:mitochondrial FAD-linked sulfhydryl oxidase ERV1 [Rhizodiscina lignyota]|uniref:Sulfhydryl oxidase n=1 Tax=Rhizodiscina lignyota TaxID=1504668 RepID=A0A9P4IMU8_9PEZI|nr:mitochondrial FAD-linked sulfhydryl oxidase ERV1 [Rhizodiscina lignyota]